MYRFLAVFLYLFLQSCFAVDYIEGLSYSADCSLQLSKNMFSCGIYSSVKINSPDYSLKGIGKY